MQYNQKWEPRGGGYRTNPDLTVQKAPVPGLDIVIFYAALRSAFKGTPEMMEVEAKPPLLIPQAYIGRGLQSQVKPSGSVGVIPNIVTGRV